MNDELIITTGLDTPRCLLLRLEGTLDGRGAPALEQSCAPAGGNDRRLVLNLAGVTSITSSGIGALLALVEEHRQEFGKIRIAAPSAAVLAVIRLLNLHHFLLIDDSEEQAIRGSEAA